MKLPLNEKAKASNRELNNSRAKELLEMLDVDFIEENWVDGHVIINGHKVYKPHEDTIKIDLNSGLSKEDFAKYFGSGIAVCEAKCIHSTCIRNVLVNKQKGLVTVVFTDGEHEIIKCKKGDHFDVRIGVALAISQHLFGSKNKFHKEVDKKTKFVENKNKDTKGKK